MIKQIQIMFCLLIFISCNELEINKSNSENQDSSKSEQTKQIRFIDILPENISDSSKVELITKWTNEIDSDTTLNRKEVTDSVYAHIELFYRNDTLVKIVQGAPFLHNGTAYYFLMDTLVCSKFECSSRQQSGRCNPVSFSKISFIYDREIIGETIDDKIGIYWGCGCTDASYFATKPENRLEVDFSEIKRLKKVANTANNT